MNKVPIHHVILHNRCNFAAILRTVRIIIVRDRTELHGVIEKYIMG